MNFCNQPVSAFCDEFCEGMEAMIREETEGMGEEDVKFRAAIISAGLMASAVRLARTFGVEIVMPPATGWQTCLH